MQISRHAITRLGGATCLLFVATFCFVAIYDFLSPWRITSESLEKFGRHYRFCVGMSSESLTTYVADKTTFESITERTFILMPAPIGWPLFVAIHQDQDGQVAVEESAFGFWIWFALTSGIIWGAWWWGVRPLLKGTVIETTA